MIVMIGPVSNEPVRLPSAQGGHRLTRHALAWGLITLAVILMVMLLV